MKKGDKEMKVWGLIAFLMLVTSAFSGAVSAENVTENLTKSIADAIRENKGLRTAVREGLVKHLVYISRWFVG